MAKEDKKLYELFFEQNVVEDEEDVLSVCEIAAHKILERFNIRIEYPKLIAAMYIITFNVIHDKVLEQEDTKKSFRLNIANCLEIGFGTREDEEDEKVGNYAMSIHHIQNNKKKELNSDETSSIELCTQWNSENIIYQTEFIKDVSVTAKKQLKELIDLRLASEELVIPLFITIHEELINYLRIRRSETGVFEYEINFGGCFSVGARETVDKDDDIYFRPMISSKLDFKSDIRGSAKYE